MSSFIPNSFQTPNDYVDIYMALLSPAEYKVLIYAVRRIFGFNKRKDAIALSQFTDGIQSRLTGEMLDHGTGLSRPTVISALAELQKYGLIVKLENGTANHASNVYELQLDADLVDLAGLKERKDKLSVANNHIANLNKTSSKARKPVLVKHVNQYWLNPFTSTGKRRLHTIYRLNTVKTQYKTSAPESESPSPMDLWNRITGEILSQSRSNTQWISGCAPIGMRGSTLIIGCINQYTADLCNSRFAALAANTIQPLSVQFVLRHA